MKLTTGTTPAALARELNSRTGFAAHIRLAEPDRYPWLGGDLQRFPGYRACVRRVAGSETTFRPRVYINRFRYRLAPGQWPFYQKHLADVFGMDDSSRPYRGNPDGVDISVEPQFRHFVEFYLDRPPMLRPLRPRMIDKAPQIENFEVRDSFIDDGIYLNCLPLPFEWENYATHCIAADSPGGAPRLADSRLWCDNPPQFAHPPGVSLRYELTDPDSEEAAGVSQYQLGWREPQHPCACPACAAHG